jgi:hypothetical protein
MDRSTAVPHLSAGGPGVEADLVGEDVLEAVFDLQDGRLTRARRRLAALWSQVPPGAPHRSAIAHWLAAATPDVQGAVRWGEQAVAAADAAADWSLPFCGTGLTLGAMYPELHLELARAYLRVGSPCGALEHLAVARNAVEPTAAGERRVRLLGQVGRLAREVDGTADGHPDEDWGWERESEQDLADFWNGDGIGW